MTFLKQPNRRMSDTTYPDIPNQARAEIVVPHQHAEPLLDYIVQSRFSVLRDCAGNGK